MTVGGTRRAARRSFVLGAAVMAIVTASAGCARFDDSASTEFSPEPTFGAADIAPVEPGAPGSSTPPPPSPAAGPCVDPDPNVVATCLDTLSGLVVLPGGASALVGERRTGTVFQVAPGQTPRPVVTVPVDGDGDGGLLDIALSPTYDEDRLLYAYITTATDNRVVRIAAGDVPKTVLAGIPRGSSSSGALDFSSPDELRVITGDGGDPTAAANPSSLAGKVLAVTDPRVDSTSAPRVVMSGIGRAGDVCIDATGSTWVTDATATEDRLSRITPEGAVVSPVWTWPDKPGVGGCAAAPGSVAVSMTGARALALVPVDPDTNAVTTPPTLTAQDRYGRLRGASLGAQGQVWVTTVNKDGGQPVPTDDRVVIVPVPAGGGGSD
ncbi:PQQ-dependent sugar dehydrogenase [Rhodococcus sp. BP-349]|uniref:PQQ-dependent sugar dehydrogenase n=1 Tax=unclassified Rhodococcus (in: high G+C Gram-positive bacteria) TaxID=192944 RepID=UPI001C9B95F9|nr:MULTISPECIES: PQQ-dependent sugar dehydrogenase [unclassified Rhodococcus (in: high G+C Gram-positive bacteria)]MBY6540829.1 PQQ-dependent sugar dehydrogenase [Rhodococcus sp. BP-363]MBY6545145.1 PQQ-dependent sugar dehydrogenase [Rhodococcus sp. BP-369]MBY6564375.1 PQQ-dependent sugar dehydrogenase [Rhodococcus sp. BP-370]MBY6578688.1 PQQ-dependent sugar dehydrogenase [Rhodococcus sp. BP-364]MBY6587989.1 PQQ-dependent sugar dehydrogenase [Rhodococcus sp. BP-358]